jgi:hypothetical protein
MDAKHIQEDIIPQVRSQGQEEVEEVRNSSLPGIAIKAPCVGSPLDRRDLQEHGGSLLSREERSKRS